jgi:hypothetical protein
MVLAKFARLRSGFSKKKSCPGKPEQDKRIVLEKD